MNSGILDAPERRISSPVTTWMAEAASNNFSGLLVTEVTSTFINSSKLNFFRVTGDKSVCSLCPKQLLVTIISAVSLTTVLRLVHREAVENFMETRRKRLRASQVPRDSRTRAIPSSQRAKRHWTMHLSLCFGLSNRRPIPFSLSLLNKIPV